jgi:hypothetical protein
MGYLNSSPDDDYNLQSMAQGGNVTTELPAASGFDGLLTTVPKALTSAAVSVGGLAKDALDQSPVGDDVRGLFHNIDTVNSTLGPMLGYAPMALGKEQRDSADAATATVSKWAETGEDPRVTGALGRTVFGPVKGLAIIGATAPVVGPWGAAALYGTTEGHDSYQQDIAAGIDPTTAEEKAAVTGAVSGAGALLPIVGKGLLQKVAVGIGSNAALDVAGRAATSEVLSANGYTAQAAQQKIFDGQSIMADIILGAAFGAHSHYFGGEGGTVKPADVNPADVDTSAAVLAQSHFERSAPGIATNPEVANLHVKTMTDALDALANGDEQPNITAEDAHTLLAGSLPDPAQDMAPHILAAAHEEIPQFADAVDPIPEIEPVAVEPSKPLGEIPPDAEGTPAPAQFDAMTQQRIDHLTSSYGDMQITRDDGTVASVNDIAREMQGQMADADSMAKAHEAAAACFISTGGAA